MVAVDIAAERPPEAPVLAAMKANKARRFRRGRLPRLSVMPVNEAPLRTIMEMAGE
jgi:predicted RNA-binding protein with PUA-like domain